MRRKILLIEDEPLICDLVAEYFGERLDAEISYAQDGLTGARMIAGSDFALAIIDASLPQIPGVELATFAANENIPVLLISGDPDANYKLKRFGYPHLEKPFDLSALHRESVRVLGESQENIRRVRASSAKMQAAGYALSAAIRESRRLLEEIKARAATQTRSIGPPRCEGSRINAKI